MKTFKTRSKFVEMNPAIQYGYPVIAGTRITTSNILAYFRGGETVESIADLYNITSKKVRAAIRFEKAYERRIKK